jgi:hypothetical protein
MTEPARPWGLVAEFASPSALLAAAEGVRRAGYRRIDAHVPFAVEGLPEALGFGRTGIPFLVLCGALLGAAGGFFMEWYAMAVWYPLNSGGRPLDSWPMFIPITFELAVLVGGLTAFVGLLLLNRLPMLYHPPFNVPSFARATQDRFFLAVEATDPLFDRGGTAELLRGRAGGGRSRWSRWRGPSATLNPALPPQPPRCAGRGPPRTAAAPPRRSPRSTVPIKDRLERNATSLAGLSSRRLVGWRLRSTGDALRLATSRACRCGARPRLHSSVSSRTASAPYRGATAPPWRARAAPANVDGNLVDEQQPGRHLVLDRCRCCEPLTEALPSPLRDLIGDATRVGIGRVDPGVDERAGGELRQLAIDVSGAQLAAGASPVLAQPRPSGPPGCGGPTAASQDTEDRPPPGNFD